jgi:signal transduction histidine kinase
MKLKTKIQLFVTLLIIIISASELIIFINKEKDRATKIRQNICHALINKMEDDIKYAVTIKNKKFLKTVLKNYTNINFIENIAVYIGKKKYISLKKEKFSKNYVEKKLNFTNIFSAGATSLTTLKIRVYYNTNDIKQITKNSINYLIILIIIFIILSFIIITVFLNKFLSPVENFLNTIRATINGKYTLMDTTQKTEFLPIFEAYNKLILNLKDKITKLEEANQELKNKIIEIQKLQDVIIRQEKLATLGTITAGIAHEINNPVGAIRGMSELALLIKDKDKYEEYFNKIINLCDRISNLVRRVKNVTQEIDSKKTELVPIKNLIEDVLELCKNAKIISNKIKIEGNFRNSKIILKCIRSQMFQVFQNLITNSAHSIKGNGIIRIDVFKDNDSLIEIIFSDNGTGISNKIKDKIFDPFFTTKGPTGTGLGLYIVFGIIKNHRGMIELLPSEKGAAFKITLPLQS